MPIHSIVSHFGMLLKLLCQIKVLFQMKIKLLKSKRKKKLKLENQKMNYILMQMNWFNDDETFVELFNNHYINMYIEKTSRLAPNCIGNPENPNLD